MGRVTIYYGEMGSGKSYSAQKYAERQGLPFYEGDDAVTPEMQRYVLKLPIPPKVLNDFPYGHLVPEIELRATMVPHLVVAQALYREEHRAKIKVLLEAHGHQVEYVLVRVPVMQNLRQLWGRKYGFFWVTYWLMNHAFSSRETRRPRCTLERL